jgi:hypothetical protein
MNKMENSENKEPERSDVESDEEFERRPSTLPNIGADLTGFSTRDFAEKVGAGVLGCLHTFGKVLNLKRLIKIVVAYDYHAALAEVDRGVETSRPLTATENGIAVGIAMTPVILHQGEPRSVLVLNAVYMTGLGDFEDAGTAELRDVAVYALAHECGHVHDLDVQATSLPNFLFNTRLGFRDGILFGIASGCWDEYIACRLSAYMGKESTLRWMEETFCAAVERAKNRADAAIRQYRMHHDVRRATDEASAEYKSVLVYWSYLLGHVDGLDRTLEEAAPKALETLERYKYFAPFVAKTTAELRTMHESYGKWPDLGVYDGLKKVAEDLLKFGGIEVEDRANGAGYVNFPFRPETIPSAAEQTAFLTNPDHAVTD